MVEQQRKNLKVYMPFRIQAYDIIAVINPTFDLTTLPGKEYAAGLTNLLFMLWQIEGVKIPTDIDYKTLTTDDSFSKGHNFEYLTKIKEYLKPLL